MSLYGQFETNPEKEVEGVAVPYESATNEDGTVPTFVISRMGKSNKKYQKALDLAMKPYGRQLQLGTLDENVAQKLFLRVFCKSVLKGWSNVRDRDGKDLPFTLENAEMLFSGLPDLYEDLEAKAKSAALFREEVNEIDAGN